MTITVASFGGGTDSTAMLIGMMEKGEKVDLILFADTGGEKPHTYDHIKRFSEWLVKNGMPDITVVRYKKETLEENCLRIKSLPSIAYGFKKCSLKFKVQPQDQFVNNWQPAKDAWARGEKVIKLIGYDASEGRRAERPSSPANQKKYQFRYPLIEWGWDRKKCIEVIRSAGLPLPGKSACFFCPSSKAQEVKQLAKDYPDLTQRAIAMEANAELTTIKGLGRDYSWTELLKFDDAQTKLFDSDWSTAEIPCGCME
ncbi:MAG: phosphoadenosine phosphosulfate reductase family protein [Sediminibacterium sp.]